MAATLVTTENTVTVADLLDNLGGVPPERVLLRPTPGTATLDDLLWYEGRANKRLCELIDGTLVEKAMGFLESALARYVATQMDNFVLPRNLGIITTADGMVRMTTGRVRIPDVAYFSWDRLPNRDWPSEPIPELAPDLAIEILSPSNTAQEMTMKRRDYFASGVKLVWEIDPGSRTAQAYTSVEGCQTLSGAEALDGGEILPGFTLPLTSLFGELDRRG